MEAQPGGTASVETVGGAASPSETDTAPLLAYRTWAWRFFAILDAVVVLAALLVLTAQGQDPIGVAMLLILAGAGIALLTVLVVGIDRAAPWAIHAIAPVCTLVIVFGVLRVFVALTSNSITIPLEVIGAALVLSRPHPVAAMPPLSRPDSRSVTLLVGGMALMQLAPYLAGPVGTGGLLGVQPADLDMSVEVRCDEVVANGPIPVAVRWTWRRWELLSPDADGMLVQWYATTNGSEAANGGLTLEHEPRVVGDHEWSSGFGAATGALEPHKAEAPFWELGIGRSDAQRGGSVHLDLRPIDPTATSGTVEVWTWYAHGDRWTQQSQVIGCNWETPA